MHWNEKGTYMNASWFLRFIPPVPCRFIGTPETGGTPAWFLILWLLCERLTVKDSPYGCRTAADSYRIPHLSFRLPFPILFDRSIINRMNIIQSSAAFIYDIKE